MIEKKNTRLTRNRENVVHFSIFNYHTFWVTVSLRSVFQSKRLRVDFALGFLNYELKLSDYHLRLKLERNKSPKTNQICFVCRFDTGRGSIFDD